MPSDKNTSGEMRLAPSAQEFERAIAESLDGASCSGFMSAV